MAQTAISLKYILEMTNGVLAIVTGWFGCFMLYHLFKIGVQRKVWSRHTWRRLPLSMQLAVSLLVISLGIFSTRVVVWFARYGGGDVSARTTDTAAFVIGMSVVLAGFLCALRVVTRPMLGAWPWQGAILMSTIYLAWSALRLL